MKKTSTINFKIEEDMKKAFLELCKDEYKTISQDLYAYVRRRLKEKEGRKILLSDLRSNKKIIKRK